MQLLKLLLKPITLLKIIFKLMTLSNNKNTDSLNFNDIAFLSYLGLKIFMKDDKPFFDTSYIPETRYLEDNWKTIKEELLVLLNEQDKIPSFEELDKGQRKLTVDGRWKTFFLQIYGDYIESNCAKCPKTAEILRKVPGIWTAMFSILEGHKHLPKHVGQFKGFLRYHLGLVVPSGKQSRIVVNNQTRYWEEGKGLLFDDMYEHEVWNDSDSHRIILFLDIERPLPYIWLQTLNRKVIETLKKTSYVQEVIKKVKAYPSSVLKTDLKDLF